MADDDDLLKLVARQAYRDATGQTLREEVVRLRAQLEKVRADRDTMIAVHDEVERERDEARHALLSRPSSELLRQVQDERERLATEVDGLRADLEQSRARHKMCQDSLAGACQERDDLRTALEVTTTSRNTGRASAEQLHVALTKISAIRDSIVGMQGFNFSEHAYPLVAALDSAGYKGAGYEIARRNLGTLIEQRDAAITKWRDAELATAEAIAAWCEAPCPCDEPDCEAKYRVLAAAIRRGDWRKEPSHG